MSKERERRAVGMLGVRQILIVFCFVLTAACGRGERFASSEPAQSRQSTTLQKLHQLAQLARSSESNRRSALLQLILHCVPPSGKISNERRAECEAIVDELEIVPIDWENRDSWQALVDTLAFDILTTHATAEYRQTVERLAGPALNENAPAALDLLNQTQTYWEARYLDEYLFCHRELSEEKARTESYVAVGALGFNFLLDTIAPAFFEKTVPNRLKLFALGGTSALGIWSVHTRPAGADCRDIPPAPAQLVYFGDGEARLNNPSRTWLNAQSESQEAFYENVKSWADPGMWELAALAQKKVGSTASKWAEQFPEAGPFWARKGTVDLLEIMSRFPRLGKVIKFVGTVGLAVLATETLERGIDHWHNRDVLAAVRTARAPIRSVRLRPQGADEAHLSEKIRLFVEQVEIAAHHFNEPMYRRAKQTFDELSRNAAALCHDKAPAEALLRELRESFFAHNGDPVCRQNFEKFLLLQAVVTRGIDALDTPSQRALFMPASSQLLSQIHQAGGSAPKVAYAMLGELRVQLAASFEADHLCAEGPGLLLQADAYLDPLPERFRVPYQAQLKALLGGLSMIYTQSPESALDCAHHKTLSPSPDSLGTHR